MKLTDIFEGTVVQGNFRKPKEGDIVIINALKYKVTYARGNDIAGAQIREDGRRGKAGSLPDPKDLTFIDTDKDGNQVFKMRR